MRNEEVNPFGGDGNFNPFGEEGLGISEEAPPAEAAAPLPIEEPPSLGGDFSPPPNLDDQPPPDSAPLFNPFGSESGPEPSPSETPSDSPPSLIDLPAPEPMAPPSFGEAAEPGGFSPPMFDAPDPSPGEDPGSFSVPEPMSPLPPDSGASEVVAVAEIVGKSVDTVSEWMGSAEILSVEDIADSIDDSDVLEGESASGAIEAVQEESSPVEPIEEPEASVAQEPDLEFDSGADPEMELDTDTGPDLALDSGVEPELDLEFDADGEPGLEFDSGADSELGFDTDGESDLEFDAGEEPELEFDGDGEPDLEFDSDVDSQPDAAPEPDLEFDSAEDPELELGEGISETSSETDDDFSLDSDFPGMEGELEEPAAPAEDSVMADSTTEQDSSDFPDFDLSFEEDSSPAQDSEIQATDSGPAQEDDTSADLPPDLMDLEPEIGEESPFLEADQAESPTQAELSVDSEGESDDLGDLEGLELSFGGDDSESLESEEPAVQMSSPVEVEEAPAEFEDGSDDLGEIDLSFDEDDDQDSTEQKVEPAADEEEEVSADLSGFDFGFGEESPEKQEEEKALVEEVIAPVVEEAPIDFEEGSDDLGEIDLSFDEDDDLDSSEQEAEPAAEEEEEVSADLSGFDFGFGEENPEKQEEEKPSTEEVIAPVVEEVPVDFEEGSDDLGAIDLSFDEGDEGLEEVEEESVSNEEEEVSADLSGFDFGFGGDASEPQEPEEQPVAELSPAEVEEIPIDFEDGPDDLGEIDLSFGDDEEETEVSGEDFPKEAQEPDGTDEEISLDSDFSPSIPDEIEMDPFAADQLEESSKEEQELAHFIEQEQLIEKMEEETHVSQPVAEEQSKVSPEPEAAESEIEPITKSSQTEAQPVIESHREKRSSQSEDLFRLPHGLLESLQESAYLLEDGFIQTNALPLDVARGSLDSAKPADDISLSRKSAAAVEPDASDLERFEIGQWDTYLTGSLSLEDLKGRLSTVFLENKEMLPDLMGYCESIGLVQGNPRATYVLSEIHKEIGESLSVISLKTECLAQLKQEQDPLNELEVCLELREYLPLDEGLVSRIARLYRSLSRLMEREEFLIEVLVQYRELNRLDLAKSLFEHCQAEGMKKREFLIAGIDLFRSLNLNQKALELFRAVESAYGLDADLVLKKGEVLEEEGAHSKALEQYKQCLSQAEEPVKVMERIVLLLDKMERIDQLSGFLNQLLSLDPNNRVGQGLAQKLKEGSSKKTAAVDVDRLERRLEELLDSKLSALMAGRIPQDQPMIPAPRPSRPLPPRTEPEDPFTKDLDRQVETLPQEISDPILRKVEDSSPFDPSVSPSPPPLSEPSPIRSEHSADQSAALRFLKDAQQKLSSPGKLSVQEASHLKEEALKKVQLIKDPVLGFFWTSEISRF